MRERKKAFSYTKVYRGIGYHIIDEQGGLSNHLLIFMIFHKVEIDLTPVRNLLTPSVRILADR